MFVNGITLFANVSNLFAKYRLNQKWLANTFPTTYVKHNQHQQHSYHVIMPSRAANRWYKYLCINYYKHNRWPSPGSAYSMASHNVCQCQHASSCCNPLVSIVSHSICIWRFLSTAAIPRLPDAVIRCWASNGRRCRPSMCPTRCRIWTSMAIWRWSEIRRRIDCASGTTCTNGTMGRWCSCRAV